MLSHQIELRDPGEVTLHDYLAKVMYSPYDLVRSV